MRIKTGVFGVARFSVRLHRSFAQAKACYSTSKIVTTQSLRRDDTLQTASFGCVLAAIILLAVFGAMNAYAGQMDLTLRTIVRSNSWLNSMSANTGEVVPFSMAVIEKDAGYFVPCLLKTTDKDATIEAIKNVGGNIKTELSSEEGGHILSAEIPLVSISEIADRDEVVFVESSQPLHSKMDTARTPTYVDVVQSGSGLGTAYNGKNVVVGVIDDGLDYGHADFMGTDGYTRIQYLKQTVGGAAVECTKRTIANSSCQITNGGQGTYHGTHVTGTAAGSSSTYTGAAPQADIMFIFDDSSAATFTSSTSLVDEASKIFEKADTIDKPAVINISLGSSLGAHDGTSLLEQSLTTLTSSGTAATKGGRIIVNAAGNEQASTAQFSTQNEKDYVGGIHSSINVTDGTSGAARMAILNSTKAASSYAGGTVVEIWLDTGTKDYCSLSVYAYTNGRSTFDPAFSGETTDSAVNYLNGLSFAADTTSERTTSPLKFSATIAYSDSRNSKPHAQVIITPESSAVISNLEDYWFDVVIRASGGNCTGHMWLYPDYTTYNDFVKKKTVALPDVGTGTGAKGSSYSVVDGNSNYTTTIPATAVGVIAAGSYMQEKPIGSGASQWTSVNGTTYNQTDPNAPSYGSGSTVNDLSNFSSLGPTADIPARTKPDVVTPGDPVVSSLASGYSAQQYIVVGTGSNHIKLQGTSMAAPHLTGIVALLLNKNNTLTVDQVRTAIRTGTYTTGLTSLTANSENSYGAGKVNAVNILNSVSASQASYSGTGDLEAPDTSSSSSSCSIGKSADTKLGSIIILVSIVVLLGYRKRAVIAREP